MSGKRPCTLRRSSCIARYCRWVSSHIFPTSTYAQNELPISALSFVLPTTSRHISPVQVPLFLFAQFTGMYSLRLAMLAIPLAAAVVTARSCLDLTIPVDISARTGVFNIAVPQTNLDATTFIQNLTQQGRNFTEMALTGYKTTRGSYNISAMLCVPSSGLNSTAPSTVQVLTHGVGFDKT